MLESCNFTLHTGITTFSIGKIVGSPCLWVSLPISLSIPFFRASVHVIPKTSLSFARSWRSRVASRGIRSQTRRGWHKHTYTSQGMRAPQVFPQLSCVLQRRDEECLPTSESHDVMTEDTWSCITEPGIHGFECFSSLDYWVISNLK